MDTAKLPPGDLKITRSLCSTRHDQHIVVIEQPLDRYGDPHLEAGAEDHALGFHLRDPAINQVLFHLEVRNAVAQQTTNPVRLFEHSRGMTSASQLLGASHACRARPDNRHALACSARRHLRRDPAFFPSAINDLALNRFDGHRAIDDVQRTGGFTGCRAHTPGKLRKVVRRLQVIQRRLPLLAIDQTVEIRDLVVDRATLVTERNPAIHAARRLLSQIAGRQGFDEFLPGPQTVLRRFIATVAPFNLQEASGLAHISTSNSNYSAATAAAVLVAAAKSTRARR